MNPPEASQTRFGRTSTARHAVNPAAVAVQGVSLISNCDGDRQVAAAGTSTHRHIEMK